VIARLLDVMEADERWRLLELSCSLARGVGDEASDIDVGLGTTKAAWDEIMRGLPTLVGQLGTPVAMLQHPVGTGSAYQRVFVQYDDGVQLDSVIFVASARPGLPPDAVALLDRDGVLGVPWEPPVYRAQTEANSDWAFLGWVALSNVGKYCGRGSLWEALAQLEQARTMVWRLWASQHQVGYPVFGLTSVLDAPKIGVPPGVEKTIAGLDREEITAAALQLADVLQHVAGEFHPRQLADFVRSQLATGNVT
jgi:hypothetical protein